MADTLYPEDEGFTSFLQKTPRIAPSPQLWQRIAADAALAPGAGTSPARSARAHLTQVNPKHPKPRHDVTDEIPWFERGLALAASLVLVAAMAMVPWLTKPAPSESSASNSSASGLSANRSSVGNPGATLPFDDETADETLSWLAALGDFSQTGSTNDTDDAPEMNTFASIGNLGASALVYAQE
jgi:hypothetical protein